MIPNQWYAIYLSKDVKKKPVGIKRFNQNLVLWRNNDGELLCMPDVCCHRKAKLSLGKINNGCLACPYHGFEYNTEGRVCKIPAHDEKEKVPSRFHVTPFVVRESEGFIWFWYSIDAKIKPLDALPWDEILLQKFNAKPSCTVVSADTFDVSYLRLLENITDLIHVPFVHAPFVPSSWSKLKDFTCESSENEVQIKGRVNNGKEGHKGLFASVHYVAPATMLMHLGKKERDPRFIASFSPIDEKSMWLGARYTQDYLPLPLFGWATSWLLFFFDYKLFQKLQDAPVWKSQEENGAKDLKGYRLIEVDVGLRAVFDIRERLIEEAKM